MQYRFWRPVFIELILIVLLSAGLWGLSRLQVPFAPAPSQPVGEPTPPEPSEGELAVVYDLSGVGSSSSYLAELYAGGMTVTKINQNQATFYSDVWSESVQSPNRTYSVEALPWNDGKGSRHVFVTHGDATVFDRTYPIQDFETRHGSQPVIQGLSNDGRYIYGTSTIVGTCPCYYSPWRLDTTDGSIKKFSDIDALWLEMEVDVDAQTGAVLATHNPNDDRVTDWDPTTGKPWELWMLNLNDDTTTLLSLRNAQGTFFRVVGLALAPDDRQFAVSLASLPSKGKVIGKPLVYVGSVDGTDTAQTVLSGVVLDWLDDYLVVRRDVDLIALHLSDNVITEITRDYGIEGIDPDFARVSYRGGRAFPTRGGDID